MTLGRGKLIEDVLNQQVVVPAQRVTAITLYNGSAVAVTGNGIDTRDCDEIVFIINAGEFLGAAAMNAAVVHSATNDPDDSALVSGSASATDTTTNANFTQITAANDNALHQASIKCKNFHRYMWLRTYQTAVTTFFSATAHQGRCDRDPQSNSPVFDINQ